MLSSNHEKRNHNYYFLPNKYLKGLNTIFTTTYYLKRVQMVHRRNAIPNHNIFLNSFVCLCTIKINATYFVINRKHSLVNRSTGLNQPSLNSYTENFRLQLSVPVLRVETTEYLKQSHSTSLAWRIGLTAGNWASMTVKKTSQKYSFTDIVSTLQKELLNLSGDYF